VQTPQLDQLEQQLRKELVSLGLAVLPHQVLLEQERVVALEVGDPLAIPQIASVRTEEDERQQQDERRLVEPHLGHGLEEVDGLVEDLLAPDEAHQVELDVRLVLAFDVALLAHDVLELVGRAVVQGAGRADEKLHGSACLCTKFGKVNHGVIEMFFFGTHADLIEFP